MDSNTNLHYEGTSVAFFNDDNGSMEKMNMMSFYCLLMNKNGFVLCSDSRETFQNGTYNEHRQKIFITKDKSAVYGCTGCIQCAGEDIVKRVNICMDFINSNLIDSDEYENDTIEDLTEKGIFLVQEAAKYEATKSIPTINNNVQWISVDINKQIQTNIYY